MLERLVAFVAVVSVLLGVSLVLQDEPTSSARPSPEETFEPPADDEDGKRDRGQKGGDDDRPEDDEPEGVLDLPVL